MEKYADKMLLGTSGWSYREWIGPFYSKEDKSMLRAYTKVFRTVEVDSSFYRYPTKGMVFGWTKYSPEGFVFTAKLPRLITHEKKLDMSQGVEKDLNSFIEIMEPLWLSGKLGCILIQLPPSFGYNPAKMIEFLQVLPTQVRFAVEFRDPSWMRKETWKMLEKYNVAYTIVDEPLLPPEIHVTSDIAYVRWHGHGMRPWYDYRYPMAELEDWVPKVKQTLEKTGKIYGFFNNHYHGYAVENCLQVLEMLGTLTPSQIEAKSRIEKHFKSLSKKGPSLEAFSEPKEENFEELLRYFMAAARMERARTIPDNELVILVKSEKLVEAKVREYHIKVDLEGRTIVHDCADWGKIAPTKKLCKHIGKLLLSIDRDKATSILQAIYAEEPNWQFQLLDGPSKSEQSKDS